MRHLLTAAAGLIVGALAVLLIPEHRFFAAPAAASAATGERWACPMMDYIGDHAGPCPVCGMALEKVTAGEITREQARRMRLATVPVTRGTAVITVRAAGSAAYDDRFTTAVIARVPGRIVKRFEATYGCCQEIEAGAPIVDLYSPEAFQAQAELAAAIRAGDGRLAASIEERFARWNLAHVAAAIRAGGMPMDTVEIRSPFAGQALLEDQDMVNCTLMVGTQIAADMPLLKLVDAARLTLVVHVPETRARFLREGQKVAIASDDAGDLPDVVATIGRVANEIDAQIRTREVRIYLTAGRRLLPGSLVTVRMRGALAADLTAADPGDESTWGRFTLVPKDAVLSTGVRNVAWRVDGRSDDGKRRFAIASLALGPRIEDDDGTDVFIVRAGLKPGDEVAARGAFLIDSQAQLAGTPSLLFPDGAADVMPAAGADADHGMAAP